MKIWTMEAIKQANAKAGMHWFEPGALRFFRGHVGDAVFQGPGGVYFVSSEQFRSSNGVSMPRRYTIRRFEPRTGSVETLGDFQAQSSLSGAKRMAKAAAEG